MFIAHEQPGSPGTKIKERPPYRYLLGVIREQRGWPVSVLPDSSVRGDRLHSHHISLVKSHQRTAANFMGSAEPRILDGPHEGHKVTISSGVTRGNERSGGW